MAHQGGITRREGLGLLALGLSGWPCAQAARAADPPARLVATWAEGGRHHAGVLSIVGETVRIEARIELPTRAHGLCVGEGGEVLVAARRPGDWLLRWQPGSGAAGPRSGTGSRATAASTATCCAPAGASGCGPPRRIRPTPRA